MKVHKTFFPCSIVRIIYSKKYELWDTFFTSCNLETVGNFYQESSKREHIRIDGYIGGKD